MTLVLLPLVLFSYELGHSDLKVPAFHNQFATEFGFQHRFYGSLADDPFGSFLGAEAGANSYLGLAFYPLKNFGVDVSRTSYDKGVDLSTGYSFKFPKEYLRWRVGAELISRLYEDSTRQWFTLGQITLQTEPILKSIKPSISVISGIPVFGNGGYRTNTSAPYLPMIHGSGFFFAGGLSVTLFRDIWYFEEVSFVNEYYLPHPGSREDYPNYGTWMAGVGASTYGHQFLFTLSNDTDIGARMLGGVTRHFEDDDTYIHLGFTIRRLLIRGGE